MTTPQLKQELSHTHTDPVHYPIDDDEPLAESEYQLFPITYAHAALTAWFEADPTTWVGSDMFLYYEEGVPARVVTPDVFVVTNTHKRHKRDIFQTWVEGRVPEFVLEIMSRTSVHNDRVTKYELYERLGVREYWLYDPTEDGLLLPRLRGNVLHGREYRSAEVEEESGMYVGVSEVLGLELRAAGDWFRFFDPASGEYLPDSRENQRARVEAERALSVERRARVEAQRTLSVERRAREDLERLLREHGIEPPSDLDRDTPSPD